MKKKKILIVLLCMMLALGMTGCKIMDGRNNYATNSNLLPIQEEKDLYYYATTHIVYIIFDRGVPNQGYGYMAPYYSENGKLCTYDTEKKQVIEIDR